MAASSNWTAENEKVQVDNAEGFMCDISVRFKLDIDPDAAFGLLIDPDNARFFRNITDCTYRKVLKDNGRGRQRVEVEHAAGWRFLLFHGAFHTRIYVEQDIKARIMAFQLKHSALMRRFEGFWKVEPFPPGTAGSAEAALVTLEQKILPIVNGAAVDWALKGICQGQIKNLMEDLKTEVHRINAGQPIPKSQLKKLKRSWKDVELHAHPVSFGSDDDSNDDTLEGPDAAASTSKTDSLVPEDGNSWALLGAANASAIPDPISDGPAAANGNKEGAMHLPATLAVGPASGSPQPSPQHAK